MRTNHYLYRLVILGALAVTPFARAQSVTEITAATGIKTGLAIHIGATDGRLEAELAATGQFVVQGVAVDEAALAKARANANGASVIALPATGRLPYSDRVANLIISDSAAVKHEELLRILAPNGALYWREQGKWSVTRGTRPAGMVEWPSFDGGAGTPYTTADTLLRYPLCLQWADGPLIGQTPAEVDTFVTVTVNHRLISLTNMDDANIATDRRKSPFFLVARDAYNGCRLWRKPYTVPDRRAFSRSQPPGYLAATGERVFVWGPKHELQILDAATGEMVKTVTPKSPRRKLGSLRAQGGLVLLQVETGWEAYTPEGEWRWSAPATDTNHLANDQWLVLLESAALRVLDVATGQQRWSVPVPALEPQGRHKVALILDKVVVVMLNGQLTSWALTDGKALWTRAADPKGWGGIPYCWQGGIAYGGTLLDPLTGKTNGTAAAISVGQCTPPLATPTFAIAVGKSGQIVGLPVAGKTAYGAVRLPCSVSAVGANGLLYSFSSDCQCGSSHVRGFSAHAASGDEVRGASFDGPRPLVAGNGKPATVKIDAGKEWPMYRQNLQRSAALDCMPVRQPRERWRASLGPIPADNLISNSRRVSNLAGLRGLTVAGGVVCVADADRLRVVALDVGTGQVKWTANTGGVVDSPPTLVEGCAVFGSHDGWVYCHNLMDGALIWKTHVAPAAAQVPVYGLVESRWPVVGAVSVQDGVVYASAGRTTAVDRGLALCALALADGKLLWARNSQPESQNIRYRSTHNDVLIGDEKELRFNGASLNPAAPAPARDHVWPADMLVPATEGLVHHTRMNQDSAYHSFRWAPMAYGGVYARNMAWRRGRVFGFARYFPKMVTNTSTTGFRTPLFGAAADTKNPMGSLLTGRNSAAQVGPVDDWTTDLPEGTQGAGFIIQGDVAVAAFNVPENGKLTGRLLTLDLLTGKTTGEVKLDVPLGLDGLVGTDRRLFVTTEDRTVICFE